MRKRIALLVALIGVAGSLFVAPAAASPDEWGRWVRLTPQVVDAAGVRTAYAVVGESDSVPLLLLNGTGSPMSQWDPALLGDLSRARPVIVYDYPGLGGSAPLPGRLTFDALAEHAAGLVTALGHREVDVLGWSMGGFVAQRLAVRSPGRVRSLVLAGTNPGGPATVLGPRWVQDADSDADGTARTYVRTNYPVGARARGWAFVRRVNAAISEGRYPADRVPVSVYDAMVAAEDPWLTSSANLSDLRGLRQPTLVITGARDVITPPANSERLAAAIPGARLRLLDAAGHSFLFQQPYRVARLVSGFLAEAGAGVRSPDR